jgi:hypothetical protein
MSLDGLDNWITKDTWYDENLGPDWSDWLDAEEQERAEVEDRAMGRMTDDDFDYETDLERLKERLNYLRGLLPPEIDDSCPF